jgi:hypothetical protein
MGLLDNNNMEYFKNKLFGYPDDEHYVEGPNLDVNSFGNQSDRIYDNQRFIMHNNKEKSYWDMLKEGNIAGPFRQNYPLEAPVGYYNRRASEGLTDSMNEYMDWRLKNK